MKNNQLSIKDYEGILHFQTLMQESKNDFPYKVLKNLADVFGFNCLSIFLVDNNGQFYNPVGINFGGENALKVYTDYYVKDDPFYFKNLANSPVASRNSITVTDIVPYDQFEKTEYYHDFFKKNDFYYEVGLYLKHNNQHIGAMGVLRSKEEEDFSIREVHLLSTLANIVS